MNTDARYIRREHAGVIRDSRRAGVWPLAGLALILAYLIYTFFAFDMPGLLQSMRLDRGLLLATDSVAHKIHVVKSFDDGEVAVNLEGTRRTSYPEEDYPGWIASNDRVLDVDLGDGFTVSIAGNTVRMSYPGGKSFQVSALADGVETSGEVPDWASVKLRKVEARPRLFKRLQVTRSKVEIHRYFLGWENFFFEFDSPLAGQSLSELVGLARSPERLDAERSNASFIWDSFWTNQEWQHDQVYKALLETIIMALMGTVVAAAIALPLAFLAAANFNKNFASRMLVRRLFDFLRGIDMLIWSLIFIRAFGLGPLTGIMAIVFTLVGELGKVFSEAIENIDNRQVEGVHSTGANAAQRYRFGVVPQIMPVFVSQTLYYLESNTRSATIIGALGAGGIGLKLVESMQTSKDWENTLYIVVLTLLVVIAMDMFSGWLRRRLLVKS